MVSKRFLTTKSTKNTKHTEKCRELHFVAFVFFVPFVVVCCDSRNRTLELTMTPRERLLTVLAGEIPDCVPVAPDFSNMIPARLTGKPFWDLYLYNDPPIWSAYIDCAKHFDIDSLMDGYWALEYPWRRWVPEMAWETFIIQRTPERVVAQRSTLEDGRRVWSKTVNCYHVDNPPNFGIDPARIGLPPTPAAGTFEPAEGIAKFDHGPAGLTSVKESDKPDFLCVGGSGTLIWQTVEMFRKLALPAVQRATELAKAAGIPTHVHSCGPEAALVEILAEETDLTVIDPLEVPPMGDCNLADLKKRFGHRLVLKGNLHTTDVMLRGSRQDVVDACKRAIDDAAAGGRFILSTGDQCGRDTPDENLRAMVETARTYGRY
jgi:uroporphyrinogen decarboxylase